MGGCPAPFVSGSHAAPRTSGVLRPPARCWLCRGVALPVLAPEKGFGLHTPSPGSCMCLRGPPRHCPSPAVPCDVLGDGDVPVSCHGITEQWHRAACGSGCSHLQRAGRRMLLSGGVPTGPSWPRWGGPGTWGPACPSARGTRWWQVGVTASRGGRDLLALPRPRRGGIRGLSGDSRSESLVSVASLNWASPDALVALVGHGLVTHLRGSHRGSVPVLVSPPQHMARQGTHGAGSGGGQGPRLVPPQQERRWPQRVLLQLHRDVSRVRRHFARSCFLLRNPMGEENTPKTTPRAAAPPDSCRTPAVLPATALPPSRPDAL